jgi:hypothetical protein
MASRVKHGWSALQNAFTALKFSTTIEDALTKTRASKFERKPFQKKN